MFLFIYFFISDMIQVVKSKVQQTYVSSIDANPSAGPYTHSPSSHIVDSRLYQRINHSMCVCLAVWRDKAYYYFDIFWFYICTHALF